VINGKNIDGDPVFNFRYIQNGERLLIAMKQRERILPEPECEVELYLGGNMGQEKYKVCTMNSLRTSVVLPCCNIQITNHPRP
jgi:hypothetical protein